jgi:hypothetical protein
MHSELLRITSERDQLHSELVRVISERDQLQSELAALKRNLGNVPPGHFYSPIPSQEEIRKDEARIFGSVTRELPGINLNEREQLMLLEDFCKYYQEMPFKSHKTDGLRYYFENEMYSYSDAIFLYCMIRHLKPNRIVEIGSGFSSCVALDTNELFFGGSISTTFVEPYPAPLMSLVKRQDIEKMRTISLRLQDVDIGEFEALGPNDILFVDSTHVSKINSDVNRIFFEILPRLRSGVHIHFHDIFYPFEYPNWWVYSGMASNEAYMLRTFLQFNDAFSIVFMNTFMERYHESFFREKMPLCLKNTGGSIWIRKQ